MNAPFRLLLVCEGNVCRSPWAEVLVRHRLWADAVDRFEVSSAGTHALLDRPAHPLLRVLCETEQERSAIEEHRSRRVDVPLLREQELVIVMERRHRLDALDSWPEGHRRVFTIGEAEQLARSGPPTPGEQELSVHEVFARRRSPRIQAGAADVPDPVRGSERDFLDMGQRLRQAVDAVVPVITAVIGVDHDREDR